MSERTVVFVGLRPSHTIPGIPSRGYRVGYFLTKEEIRHPWVINKYAPTEDISDLMEYYGWTVRQALETMNR